MGGSKKEKKPTTAAQAVMKRKPRVERLMKKQGPLEVENTKKVLIFKGHKTSQVVVDVMRDIAKISKPHCKTLGKNNEILPFEDANSIEFLTTKNDTSLFAMGSHTKKRPHNIVLGRTYDGHVLDMFEFGIDNFESLESIKGFKKSLGSKPCLVFLGDQWSADASYDRVRNFFIDFFRGDKVEKINLKGIDHVMVFAVVDKVIHLRTHCISFMKSGTKVPNVKLGPMGPNMDLTLRRSTLAGDDMWKASLKQPVTAKTKKVKNVSVTSIGDKVGRIHMKKQDLNNMGGRRMPVLRTTSGGKKRREREQDGPAIVEDVDAPSGRGKGRGGKRARSR